MIAHRFKKWAGRCILAIMGIVLVVMVLPNTNATAKFKDKIEYSITFPMDKNLAQFYQGNDFSWEGNWTLYIGTTEKTYEGYMTVIRNADGTYSVTDIFEPATEVASSVFYQEKPGVPKITYEVANIQADQNMVIVINIFATTTSFDEEQNIPAGTTFHTETMEITFQRTNNPDQLFGQVVSVSTHKIAWGLGTCCQIKKKPAPEVSEPVPYCALRNNAPVDPNCLAGYSGEVLPPVQETEAPQAVPTTIMAQPEVGAVTDASFSVSMGCYDKVTSEENIGCSATIYPDEELAGSSFSIVWSIDGAYAAEHGGAVTSDAISIPPLPPGSHQISVYVQNLVTGESKSASTVTQVETAGEGVVAPPIIDDTTFTPISTNMVSPVGQTAAAVGTLAVLAAWLWMEYSSNSQRYEQIQNQAEATSAGEQADRQAWYDRQVQATQQQHIEQLTSQGFVYDSTNDIWRPGPMHPDYYDHSIIRQGIDRFSENIRNLLHNLPPTEQVAISELIDKTAYDGDLSLDNLSNLNVIRHAVMQQIQGQHEFEQAQAQIEVENAEDDLNTLFYTQVGTTLVAVVATGGVYLFDPLNFAAFSTQMAALGLVGNVTVGAVGGYMEGGIKTSVIRVAQNTLPINSLCSLLDPNSNVGELGIGMLRDLGNVLTLSQGGPYIYQQLTSGAAAESRNLIQALPNAAGSSADDGLTLADDVKPPTTGRPGGRDLSQPITRAEAQVIDDAWRPAHQQAEQRIRQYQNLIDEYNNPATSGARRTELESQLDEAVHGIRGNYQQMSIVKHNGTPQLQNAYNTGIRRTNNAVSDDFFNGLAQNDVRRGGAPMSGDDFFDVRNVKSGSSPGMDRDWALVQEPYRQARDNFIRQLRDTAPGSKEAERLHAALTELRNRSQITINGRPVSDAEAAEFFQQQLNTSFEKVTGESAEDAMQLVTHRQHPEEYADMPAALANDSTKTPFNRSWATQTASVNPHKTHTFVNSVRDGTFNDYDGIQEIARGTSKEIGQKIRQLMEVNANVPSEKLTRLVDMHELLDKIGKQGIDPGKGLLEFQDRFGVTLTGAAEETGSIFEQLIKG